MKEYEIPFIKIIQLSDSLLTYLQPSGVINLGPASDQYAIEQFVCNDQGDLEVAFDVTGITPTNDGMLKITLSGDIGASSEYYTIALDGNTLSPTMGAAGDESMVDCTLEIQHAFNIPLSQLLAAAQDGVITITAAPSDEVHCNCGNGPYYNRFEASLSFEGTRS